MSQDTPVKEKCSKQPPTTVKRRAASADMSRSELLQLLSVMEGELQAREVSLAVLKAEKTQHFIRQALYDCVVTAEGPYDALQRDAELSNKSATDTDMSSSVVNAKQVLDGFVETQRKTQLRTRIQLASIEKQFHKVCAEVESEKRKNAEVVTDMNDIRSNFELEKQKLQQQFDELKEENNRLVLESQELKSQLTIEKAEALRHSQAAAVLARERTWLAGKLTSMDQLFTTLENNLVHERKKAKALASELSQVNIEHRDLEEKWAEELACERERNQVVLNEKETRLSALSSEVEQIRLQLLHLQYSDVLDGHHPKVGNSSVDCSSLPSMVNTSHVDIDRLSAGEGFNATKISSDTTLPITESRELLVGSGMDHNKSLIAGGGLLRNDSSLLENNSSGRFGLITGISRSPTAGIQGSPSAIRKQGLLEVTNTADFVTLRQAKSADLSNISLSMVESHHSSGIGGSCPSELSSGLLPISEKSNSGISSSSLLPVPQNVAANTVTIQSHPLPANNMALDIFGPEMADLQELIKSMATSDKAPTANVSHMPSFPSGDLSPPMPSQSQSSSSALHAAILAGNGLSLFHLLSSQKVDLNESIDGGIWLLHCAVECGSEDCVRVLLESGAAANLRREDGRTPLHLAASDGHVRCLQLLLEFHGSPVAVDRHGWTPLHCAASVGHVECCRILLEYGARIDAVTSTNWTPLHVCIQAGHSACLVVLLTHHQSPPSSQSGGSDHTMDQWLDTVMLQNIANISDKDGRTLGHLATVRETKDCLEILMRYVHIDVERRDKWSRSVLEVASPACRQCLLGLDGRQDIMCTVTIDVPVSTPFDSQSSPKKSVVGISADDVLSVTLGSVVVSKGAGWSDLEEKLNTVFLNHISEVSVGLRTKKTSRFDQDWPDPPSPLTLGISLNSIKYFSIGRYHWSPGTTTDKMPYDMLCGFNSTFISIELFGLENGMHDSVAYETTIPVSLVQNYLRLIEQYKSVVFYGPKGMGKTYLVKKLAQCIQTREKQSGNTSEVTFFTLTSAFSRKDLLKLLFDKGCLIASSSVPHNNLAPVLVLDDLSKISVVEVFKDILPAVEMRGPANSIIIRRDGSQEAISCYMHTNCYIIGTMDRSRSTGLELSIQQRFKWVQLRCDQEPMRCLLHRHMLRRLAHSYRGIVPMPDNSVYKAVEWVICVWQRLNEGLSKLGLLDMVFGPCFFLNCPVEANKPKPILTWLCHLWNTSISPAIADAVIKGSGAETSIPSGGQTKVASTALYVLMQRAVVPGCPLSGLEKDRYFANFSGTNELDIKVRGDKRDSKPAQPPVGISSSHPFQTNYTATMKLNKSAMSASASSNAQNDGSALHGDTTIGAHHGSIVNGNRVLESPTVISTTSNELLSVGNSLFAVSGIPSKSGAPMHLTNGTLIPGSSLITSVNQSGSQTIMARGQTSANSDVHERLSLTKVSTADIVSSAKSITAGSVSQGSRAVVSDSLFGIVARPNHRATLDSVPPSSAGSLSLSLHASVIMTQPGRLGSPMTNADRSRSMTPPSSVNIDRGSVDRAEIPARLQSLVGIRAGSEVPYSNNSTEFADMRSAELSIGNRTRNDVSYNVSSPSHRPSSAGSGVEHYAGIENGGRIAGLKPVNSARASHLSDVVFSNSPVK